jgi:hypothetical protein
MRPTHCISLLLLLTVPFARAAEKKRWDIPDEERIARRLDRESIRERAPKGKGDEYAALGTSVIRGRRNPELFMPWELYRDAVSTYFAMPDDWRARHRAQADDELRVITDPVAFWKTFEETSAPYAAMLERERILLERLNAADPKDRPPLIRALHEGSKPQCAARADTLKATEQAIDRDVLYQFLYEIVAVTHSSTTTGPERAEQLRFVTGGCR